MTIYFFSIFFKFLIKIGIPVYWINFLKEITVSFDMFSTLLVICYVYDNFHFNDTKK